MNVKHSSYNKKIAKPFSLQSSNTVWIALRLPEPSDNYIGPREPSEIQSCPSLANGICEGWAVLSHCSF